MVADKKTIFFQLEEGEEIGNPIADEPKMEQVLVLALLGHNISNGIAISTEGAPPRFEVV
jgi:hypothetical protein